MANWKYYNENGEKIAVTGGQLKELAKQGTITPETFVETHDGRTGLAKHVTGLTFPEPSPIKKEFEQVLEECLSTIDQQPSIPLPSHTPIINSFAIPIPSTPIQHTPVPIPVTSIQYEYKCVAAPMIITISSSSPAMQATEEKKTVESFGEIINEECHDDWEFYSMEQITVKNNPGCLGAFMGVKAVETVYNMLVFRKPK